MLEQEGTEKYQLEERDDWRALVESLTNDRKKINQQIEAAVKVIFTKYLIHDMKAALCCSLHIWIAFFGYECLSSVKVIQNYFKNTGLTTNCNFVICGQLIRMKQIKIVVLFLLVHMVYRQKIKPRSTDLWHKVLWPNSKKIFCQIYECNLNGTNQVLTCVCIGIKNKNFWPAIFIDI